MASPSPNATATARKLTLKLKLQPNTLPDTDTLVIPDLPLNSTVGALRFHLEEILPSHPREDRQRLLYCGRAIIDNGLTLAAALGDIGRRADEDYERVVHLVVRPDVDAIIGTGFAGSAMRPRAATPAPVPIAQIAHQPVPHDMVQFHQEQAARQQAMIQQMVRAQQQQEQQGMVGVPGLPLFTVGTNDGANEPANGTPTEGSAETVGGFLDSPPASPQPQSQQHEQTGQQVQQPPPPIQFHQAHQQAIQQLRQLQHLPPRPISGQGFTVQGIGPNGERITINNQTLNFRHAQPGQQVPFPQLPQLPQGLLPQFPAIPNQGQPGGRSALDTARINLAEMQRMLTELRGQNALTDEQSTRFDGLEERTRAIGNYIDPLHLGATPTNNTGRRSASPRAPIFMPTPSQPQAGLRFPQPQHLPGMLRAQGQANTIAHTAPMATQNNVTVYLLSSPTGPQALLFHPQHGNYTAAAPNPAQPVPSVGDYYRTGVFPAANAQAQAHAQAQAQAAAPPAGTPSAAPAPTPTVPPPAQPAGADVAVNNQQLALRAAQPVQPAQPNQAAGDPLAPIQPVLNNLWMLLRLIIFAYFILGSGLGWRRPAILAAVGLLFWLARHGPGEGRVQLAVRQWWEGIVGIPGQAQGQGQGQGQGQAPAQNGNQPEQRQQQQQAQNRLPTPEELAQRLIAQREQQGPAGWLREQIRPVERAAALFVASLWPGIGEAHVRARRELEERRAASEEAARRERMEMEERRTREAENAVADDAKEGGSEEKKEEASDAVAETNAGEGGEAAADAAGGSGEVKSG